MLSAASRVNPTCGVKPGHDALSTTAWGLRRKPEMHDVAVGDDVGLTLEPHLARLLRAGLAAERHVIVVGDGLGADEAALEIGMDDGGSLRRLGSTRDRPGRRLLGAGGEIGDQVEERIPGANQSIEARLLEPD